MGELDDLLRMVEGTIKRTNILYIETPGKDLSAKIFSKITTLNKLKNNILHILSIARIVEANKFRKYIEDFTQEYNEVKKQCLKK